MVISIQDLLPMIDAKVSIPTTVLTMRTPRQSNEKAKSPAVNQPEKEKKYYRKPPWKPVKILKWRQPLLGLNFSSVMISQSLSSLAIIRHSVCAK